MHRRSFFRSLAAIAVAGPLIRKLKPIAALDPPYSKLDLLATGGDPQPSFNPKAYYGKWQFVTVGPGTFPYNAGETIR